VTQPRVPMAQNQAVLSAPACPTRNSSAANHRHLHRQKHTENLHGRNWVRFCAFGNWLRPCRIAALSGMASIFRFPEFGFFRKLICDHVFAMTYSQRKNSARAPLGLLKFSFPAVRPSLIGVSNVQKARDQPWPVQIGFFRELICDYVFALTYSQRNAVLGLRRRCSNFHLRR